MPIKIRTKGKVRAEFLTAIRDWVSGVSGQNGVMTVSGTRVLWRPAANNITVGVRSTPEGEGGYG